MRLSRADHLLAPNLKRFFLSCTNWNDSTYRRQTKYSPFISYRTNKIRLRLQNFLCQPMKVEGIPGVLFASCSNAPKRGKKCDEFKSLYQNILKLPFCGHISLLQRKQHHFQFHLTWARGTQFGQGPVLAVHLSESVSPFARNFPPWQQIYSAAQGSRL